MALRSVSISQRGALFTRKARNVSSSTDARFLPLARRPTFGQPGKQRDELVSRGKVRATKSEEGPMNENASETNTAKSKAQELKYNGKRPSAKKSRKSKKRKPTVRRTSRKAGTTRSATRARQARPYPAAPFEEARVLAEAIQTYASGRRVRRLTLLAKMDRSPNSGPTKMLITTSGKYGFTKGSYSAEYLELTDLGRCLRLQTRKNRLRYQPPSWQCRSVLKPRSRDPS